MIHAKLIVRCVGFLVLAVLGWLAFATPAQAADPVDDLRLALPLDDVSNPSEAVLQFRRANLQKKIDALANVGHLRRALVLDSWRDDPARGADFGIRRIDADMRREVAKRFTEMLEAHARSAAVDNRIAAATLIAEMGPSVRALTTDVKKPLVKKAEERTPEEGAGFSRTLLPILEILVKDKDASVREHALRALGNINADPKKAGPLFGAILKSDPSAGPRRIAADGLGQMVRVVSHLHGTSPFTRQVTATRAEVLDVLNECAQKCAIGFQDADSLVRKHAIDAMLTAVQIMSELVPEPFSRTKLPPADRPLDEKETRELALQTQELVREIAEIQPLLAALRTDVDLLPGLLKDPDRDTRMAALDTLRYIAMARQRLIQRVLSMPNRAGGEKANLALLAGADPLENFLRKDLGAVAVFFSDANVQFRKIAALLLFHLEDRALPVSHVLFTALGDSDRSIRWIAARAVAQLPPEKASGAVTGLAKLLRDEDVLLRIAAANALEAMGRHAGAAADALAQATTVGDTDGRRAAMAALRALGPESAAVAVPKLIEVLGQADADDKALVEACQTLGHYGAGARSALKALRRLLGHDDSEVRIAACEAILAVNVVPKK